MNESEEKQFEQLLINDPEIQERFKSFFVCQHPTIDVATQFDEIKLLITESQKRCQELDAEIESSEVPANDLMYVSTYRDIAHSMTAVGALAPFIESIFVHSLGFICSQYNKQFPSEHPRWQSANQQAWDCHFLFNKNGSVEKNIQKGIIQLLEALNIRDKFPNSLEVVLTALFAYRNKMFHGGYEWLEDERSKFWERVEKEWNIGGNEWFQKATFGDNIWMVYMSDAFIDECMVCIKDTLSAFENIFMNIRDKKELSL